MTPMAKRTQPALYELMRTRAAERRTAVRPSVPAPAPVAKAPKERERGPVRTLRIPLAWVWTGAVALVAAVTVAYLFGVRTGEDRVRARVAADRGDEVDRLVAAAGADPLVPPPAPIERTPPAADRTPSVAPAQTPAPAPVRTPPTRATPPAPAVTPTSPEPTRPNPPAASGNPAPAVPASADPREPGLNYFVVAQVAGPSADKMVGFCRDQGLDAHSVPDDTGSLRLVIVAPGFASGERRSEAVRGLEARIRAVGLQWKAAARGNRDFSDVYPKKHAAQSE